MYKITDRGIHPYILHIFYFPEILKDRIFSFYRCILFICYQHIIYKGNTKKEPTKRRSILERVHHHLKNLFPIFAPPNFFKCYIPHPNVSYCSWLVLSLFTQLVVWMQKQYILLVSLLMNISRQIFAGLHPYDHYNKKKKVG